VIASPWPVRPLSEIVELQRGHDLPSSQRVLGNVPIIGSFGVTGFHDRSLYAGPGVAIGRSGASIGAATFVDLDFWPLNTCLFVCDFKGNDPRWVYRMLDQIDFAGFNSGSAQPSLNRNFLRSIPVSVPSLEEQRAIAEVLGALDDKIAANEHTVAVMDDLSFALVRAGNQTPEARLAQVGQVMSLKYGKALPAASRRDGTVTVFGSGGPVGVHDRALVNGPGVVIGRKGTVGAVYWADGPHYPIDTTYYVEPLEGLAPEILYYALRDVRLADLNSDSAVPGLNRDEACTQIVCLPGPGDHERITADVRHNFDAARAIRAESQCLRGTRDELLPLLMSGRLRVKDAEKVVAEVV
jgi:type I restriction enzyme, S subunit